MLESHPNWLQACMVLASFLVRKLMSWGGVGGIYGPGPGREKAPLTLSPQGPELR